MHQWIHHGEHYKINFFFQISNSFSNFWPKTEFFFKRTARREYRSNCNHRWAVTSYKVTVTSSYFCNCNCRSFYECNCNGRSFYECNCNGGGNLESRETGKIKVTLDRKSPEYGETC